MNTFISNMILVNSGTAIIIGMFILMRQVLKSKIHTAVLCTLWTLIFLRMLIPVQIETDFNFLNNSPVTEVYSTLENIEYFNAADVSAEPNSTLIVDTADEAQTIKQNNTSPARNVNIPLILYAVGGAIALGYILFSNIAFGRYIRREGAPIELSDADKAVFEQQSIKQLKVYFAEGLKSPCLYGIFNPKILLNGMSISNDKVRRYSLYHETTHYKHKDNLWLALGLMACVINWFNPMMWLALHLSKKDREVYCDERVIKQIGEDEAVDYGKSLLMIALNRSNRQLTVSTTMTGGKKEMKQRIKNIAGNKKAWIIVSAVVVILIAGLFAVTSIINSGTMKFSGEIEKIINPYDYPELVELFDSGKLPGVTVHEIYRMDIDGDGENELYTNSSIDAEYFQNQFIECYDYKNGKYSNIMVTEDCDYRLIVYEEMLYIFETDFNNVERGDVFSVYNLEINNGKISYSELDNEFENVIINYVFDNVSIGILGDTNGPTAIFAEEDITSISIYDISSGEDKLIRSVNNKDVLEQFMPLYREFNYIDFEEVEQSMKAVINFEQHGVEMDIELLFGHKKYISYTVDHMEYIVVNNRMKRYLYSIAEGNY